MKEQDTLTTPKMNNCNLYEFNNLLDIYKLKLKQNKITNAISKAKSQDTLYRKYILSEYYNTSFEVIDKLIKTSPENRRSLCENEGINGYVFRTLFDYNSYPDCYLIYNLLSSIVDFSNLKILDFGCLVSDYGFFFGNLGASITFCDFKEEADFADFRLGKANINRNKIYAPANYQEITKGQDLAIFGEVLEHLRDPFNMLQCGVENKIKYIYTSCYPYGNEAYFNYPGHTKEAKAQSKQCIDLLKSNFEEISLVKYKRLWVAKYL